MVRSEFLLGKIPKKDQQSMLRPLQAGAQQPLCGGHRFPAAVFFWAISVGFSRCFCTCFRSFLGIG